MSTELKKLSYWDKAHLYVAFMYVLFSTLVFFILIWVSYIFVIFCLSVMCSWETIPDQLITDNVTINFLWLKYHLNVTAKMVPDVCRFIK